MICEGRKVEGKKFLKKKLFTSENWFEIVKNVVKIIKKNKNLFKRKFRTNSLSQ